MFIPCYKLQPHAASLTPSSGVAIFDFYSRNTPLGCTLCRMILAYYVVDLACICAFSFDWLFFFHHTAAIMSVLSTMLPGYGEIKTLASAFMLDITQPVHQVCTKCLHQIIDTRMQVNQVVFVASTVYFNTPLGHYFQHVYAHFTQPLLLLLFVFWRVCMGLPWWLLYLADVAHVRVHGRDTVPLLSRLVWLVSGCVLMYGTVEYALMHRQFLRVPDLSVVWEPIITDL